jgi:oligopeptide transport system ATP-binding protein
MLNHALLRINDLRKYYAVTAGMLSRQVGEIKAVDGVSFHVAEREILGLVGESGCGKSTLGRTILRLEEPTSGEIFYRGNDIVSLDKKGLRALRKKIQIILQDPDASLDPRMTAGDSISEPLVIHDIGNDREHTERVAELMQQVGLDPRQTSHYPHEFSGRSKPKFSTS